VDSCDSSSTLYQLTFTMTDSDGRCMSSNCSSQSPSP
jgi:hypothetical protein